MQKAIKTHQKRKTKELKKLEQKIRKNNELEVDDQIDGRKALSSSVLADSQNMSVLFEPYRALGYYTSSVPICVYKSGEDTLIASVVGKHAFYVYNTEKLSLVFMSRFIPEEITYL